MLLMEPLDVPSVCTEGRREFACEFAFDRWLPVDFMESTLVKPGAAELLCDWPPSDLAAKEPWRERFREGLAELRLDIAAAGWWGPRLPRGLLARGEETPRQRERVVGGRYGDWAWP